MINRTKEIKGNEIICDFMGFEITSKKEYIVNGFYYSLDELQFASDWNDLMTIVKGIYELGISGVAINELKHEILSGDIDRVFIAVVDFIKWYNENK